MRFLVVAGARPNFMKVAPVMEAFRQRSRPDVEVLLVHTGQHYDPEMSGHFFQDLDIPTPDINLGVGSGTHAQQTARVMVAFETVCFERKPGWVVVVGDVNSTLACALTAKKLGIRVAHVEAGLRSGDMTMPEEINRLCTDAIADLLFCTDAPACQNLRREGLPEERIHFVGNTMIDTLRRHIDRARAKPLPAGFSPGEFAVLTLHRPSNVDHRDTLRGIFQAIAGISQRLPVAFPIHPRTLARASEFGLLEVLQAQPGIRLLEPLSYLSFLGLVAHCRLVLTDSGGIQEETTVLGVPCLTLRSNTERPITCELGTNILVGSDGERIRQTAFALLERSRQAPCVPDKWDGHAAERIVDILLAAT
jgi:UDP-N-acetylglucosamine 2-epimerase (non-hydrolysing)